MAHPDAELAALARTAHGVVTRRGLLAAGLTHAEIRHRQASGALHIVHRGVYRVGHLAPSTDADYLAAVFAGGDDACLAGLAAAWQFGVVRGRPPVPEVWTRARRRIAGVATRCGVRDPRDRTIWRGIPTVTVARCLVELAGVLDAEGLATACHEAGARFATTPRHVGDALSRWPTAPGARALRSVMAGDVNVVLSRLERNFLRLLRAEGLPLPVTNRPAGGRRVDCRWHDRRLTVELDSFRFHNSRRAWERDRQREREAYARGDDFRRYTWTDVTEAPAAMLRELHALLRARYPHAA